MGDPRRQDVQPCRLAVLYADVTDVVLSEHGESKTSRMPTPQVWVLQPPGAAPGRPRGPTPGLKALGR